MDKFPVLRLLGAMAHQSETENQPAKKRVTPVSLVVDLILVVGFFLYLYSLLKIHVPSNDPKMVMLWAGLTALCMSGVFWLAIQMFRTVLSFQLETRKK